MPIVQCPWQQSLPKEDDLQVIKVCFGVMEEVQHKPYKKSYFGGKIENSYLGIDILTYIEES